MLNTPIYTALVTLDKQIPCRVEEIESMRRWMLRSLFLWQHNVLAIGRKIIWLSGNIRRLNAFCYHSHFLIYIICCGKWHTFLTPSTCHPKVGLKSVDDDYKVSATHVYMLCLWMKHMWSHSWLIFACSWAHCMVVIIIVMRSLGINLISTKQ